MINSYCENIENMFAQMVYYGVLKEEDAKCFSVTSKIEPGAFFLAFGAILLGFLSTFVFKAIVQYLKDDKEDLWRSKEFERCHTSLDSTCHSVDNVDEEEDDGDDYGASGTIRTPPVLFTDSFRWMLKPDNDSMPSSSRALFGDPNNVHWCLPEATAIVDDESLNENIIKGTYVRDVDEYHHKSLAGSPSREDSMESSSKESSPLPEKGRKLTYDESKNEVYSYPHSRSLHPQDRSKAIIGTMDTDQQSIPSKMSSVGSSFKDEGSILSEMESLVYSLPSSASACPSSQIPPPPPDLVRKAGLNRSDLSVTKTPAPPSFYRTASLPQQPSSPRSLYYEQPYCFADNDPKLKTNPNQDWMTLSKQGTPNKKTLSNLVSSEPKKQPPLLKRAPQPRMEEDVTQQIIMDDAEMFTTTTDDDDNNNAYFKTKQPPPTRISQHGRPGIV
jgi:hypothetical protein